MAQQWVPQLQGKKGPSNIIALKGRTTNPSFKSVYLSPKIPTTRKEQTKIPKNSFSLFYGNILLTDETSSKISDPELVNR